MIVFYLHLFTSLDVLNAIKQYKNVVKVKSKKYKLISNYNIKINININIKNGLFL